MTKTSAAGASTPTLRWPRVLLALAGLALAGSTLTGVGAGIAGAQDPVDDGSDWGSQGTLSTDSPVTVRWDNTDNPSTDVVPRDGRQVIPHTGDKTYDDVSARIADDYAQRFGPDNGLGGLQVTVSQTKNLTYQAVTVDFSGATGGTAQVGANSDTYLQVFQCWGGLTADGKPDLQAANPDPATCQVGATGPDRSSPAAPSARELRRVQDDPLLDGGDWSSYSAGDNLVPFTAINGDRSKEGNDPNTEFYNSTTTNEQSNVVLGANGAATRQFEIQTSREASALGCGRRPDAPSSSTCWLVVVPRIKDVMEFNGPISPSIWAQRLQVKLDFRDVAVGCPGGQARSLIAGSEFIKVAADSWTPGVCAGKKIALGYSQLGDEVVRNQFVTKTNPAVLTSEPIPAGSDAIGVPVALAAPVFAYQLAYQPQCVAQPGDTEERAHSCGYDSLADMVDDANRAGQPVRDIKLDARLVVKLLSQSYQLAILAQPGFDRTGWMVADNRPTMLAADPEFRRLNPGLAHLNLATSGAKQLSALIVEGMRSDGASAVWRWIMDDPDASAFLNGCPDPDGMTINPFFSSRTYIGCEDQKAALAAQAKTDREESNPPSTYVDAAIVYPPLGAPYPLPTWREWRRDGQGADGTVTTVYTVIDQSPRSDSMPGAGREAALGHIPRNSTEFCFTQNDDSCQPAPGKFPSDKSRQQPTQLAIMSITDSATAAQYRLPTAVLCDDSGDHCVGADDASLTAAANRFVDEDGWSQPAEADYKDGAYPLTLPVYAAVDATLPLADRTSYADALDYITTNGQRPGFEAGQLPPGYAHLTDALLDQAADGIAALRKPADKPSDPPTDDPTDQPDPGPDTTVPSDDPKPSKSPDPGPKHNDGQDTTDAQIVAVSAGTETWPGLTVPFLLAIALTAGIGGPIIRLRGKFTVRR